MVSTVGDNPKTYEKAVIMQKPNEVKKAPVAVEAAVVEAPEAATPKTTIRPDTSEYKKARSAGGGMSQHNGDVVAVGLAGMNVLEVAKVASLLISGETEEQLLAKYSHLNIGQQRMALGNRVRGAVAKINKANAAEIAKVKEGETAPTLVSGEDKFEAAVKPMRRDIDARQAQAEAEAKKKAEEAAAKKKAAAEKKAADKAAAEKKAADKAAADKAEADKAAKAA